MRIRDQTLKAVIKSVGRPELGISNVFWKKMLLPMIMIFQESIKI